MSNKSKTYEKSVLKNLPAGRQVYIRTFGCQMNEYDSEVMAGILKERNYVLIDKEEEADVILLNTCSIRQKTEEKVYGKIERLKELKKNNRSLILGVCGCMAQKEGMNLQKRFSYLDLVLGTYNLHKLPFLIDKIIKERKTIVETSKDDRDFTIEAQPYRRNRVKAWVPVMRGCDNFCTYCVVPYVRGRQRSRKKEDVIREIKVLAQEGYKEITLLGQKVDAYGKDLKENIDFADLLEMVEENASGIERIRFVTSHPREMTPKLIRKIKSLPKVCEYFHLPVQAGSNAILKKMKRGYTEEFYEEMVVLIRKEVSHCSVTTDIMVGFPGETEEDFNRTLDLVGKIRFDFAFTFKYSPRPGTAAFLYPENVSEEVKKERLARLIELQNKISKEKNESLINKVTEVLVEEVTVSVLKGRTRTNKIVIFKGCKDLLGKLVKVKITQPHTWTLGGKLTKNEE